jgi:hypothetical protein
MKYLLWLGVSVFCLSVNSNAQQPQSARCPEFYLDWPRADLKRFHTYTIELKGDVSDLQLTYKWEPTIGTILSGQGTKVITFHPGKASSWLITLTIEGLPTGCQNMKSISTVVDYAPVARKFNEITITEGKRYTAQLDAFAKAVQNELSYGFILAYAGRKQHSGGSSRHAANAKEYLMKVCGLDPDRITIIEGGTRVKETLELWIAPAGSAVPVPIPPRLKP